VNLVRNLLVILDGTPGAHQAAYTAYDVAARTGARLVGAALSAGQDQKAAEQTRRDFEIGARAAGARVRVIEIETLSQSWSAALELKADAIFIGQNSLTSKSDLQGCLKACVCPLWVVPAQREIHNLGVLYDDSLAAPLALAQGLDLSRRWGLYLTLLTTATSGMGLDDLLPRGETSDVHLNLQLVAQPDQAAIYNQIVTQEIDLAMIGQPQDVNPLWGLCQRANCLLAIYPVLNSS
jgi:hypothetical protein